jgi:anti-anti-sigma factor
MLGSSDLAKLDGLDFVMLHESQQMGARFRKLLSEYGGTWITADKFSKPLGARTFTVLTDSDGEIVKQMMQKGGAKVADIPVNHTVIQDGSAEEAMKYFEERGFEIKTASYGDKLPELPSLRDCPDIWNKLREAYHDVIIWSMSVRPAGTEKQEKSVKSGSFGADFSCEEGRLLCRLSGRLDTITAPEFLTAFQEYQTGDLKEITLDLEDTEYISSAGLRVLLILYKSLPAPGCFYLKNISETVMEILDVTGFANIFGIQGN